jgi:choline dehydrogenase-like flavoprotein
MDQESVMSQANAFVSIVDNETVLNTHYDAVIVGGGIAGAITARQLSDQGKTVLILEAGTGEGLTLEGFQSYVDRFYSSVDKHGNAPYPANWNAASPTDDSPYPYVYFEEKGPLPLSGSYTRILGGTTMHWEGKTLRMLPEDFDMFTRYGHGLDWPIGYDDLEPYYRKAEIDIGVAGNTEQQKELGIPFEEGYALPMMELPPSYLDQKVGEKIAGMTTDLGGETFTIKLSTFPQGRNSVPNPDFKAYNNGYDYVPQGIASDVQVEYGERCQGNANCVSICPVQAKYDARKALHSIRFPERVHLLTQAVAYKVEVDPDSGRVTGIKYKRYGSTGEGQTQSNEGRASGTIYVLAANAVENAKLMLGSEIPNLNRLMGCNLMDHPFLLAWGLMPEVTGSLRGPLVTSGIGCFRKGNFRSKQCAFGVDIHNDGWGWSGTGVSDIVRKAVDEDKLHGFELRQELVSKISRQILLAFMCELPAMESNKVTVDPAYKDQLGNYRPVINFNLPDYCKETFAYARGLSKELFNKIGVEDHTDYLKKDKNGNLDPAFFTYEKQGYWFRGGNHFSGTHIMGTAASNSVVNDKLKSWEHENLYMLGSGSMPTIGTSNTTLTIVALCYRAAEQMLRDLA